MEEIEKWEKMELVAFFDIRSTRFLGGFCPFPLSLKNLIRWYHPKKNYKTPKHKNIVL